MGGISLIGSGGLGVGELFQVFRDGRGRTKADIGKVTGLSRQAVSARVDPLLAAGLLTPVGAERSTGGRPPVLIALNPSAGAVLAIDLGATYAKVAVTDLSASVLATRSMDMAISDGPEPVLDHVMQLGADLLAQSAHDRPLVGVGIGLPGAVEHTSGRPIAAPIMPGWDRFDVPGYAGKHFPCPILVDNDVNVLALGEHALTWPDVDDLVFVKVATGLGAGIIAGGQLQRGAQGVAGDIGHVLVPYGPHSRRPPGDERILGDLASGTAIARELAAAGLPASNSQDVISLVRAGDPRAMAATRQAGRELGEVLSTLVNTLNPSIIVLGGSIARAGEELLAGVREIVYRRSLPVATEELRIVHSEGSDQAGVLGAAILAIDEALSPAAVERFVLAAS